MEFNNGAPIDFDIIKANREIAVKEIAEGNPSLERLMNYCIDNNIRTYASCGDDAAYISFELNDKSRDILFSLIRKILSNQKLWEIAMPTLGLSDEIKTCTFYRFLNDYGIDNNNFFDLILEYFINYSIDKNIDIAEFECSEKLLESLYSFGFNSVIEFLEKKQYSTDATELSQYKVTVFGEVREGIKDYILNTIIENYPKFVYSSENYDFIFNIKYYEIMHFEDLKDCCNVISKKGYTRTLKKDK